MTLALFGRTAVLSQCGRYRYRLDDQVDGGPGRVVWVMLNPSKADAFIDDPTFTRCLGFSRALGCSATVVNLFAWRATRPVDLPSDIETAIGPDADMHIRAALVGASVVICGWGTSIPARRMAARERAVLAMIRDAGHVPQALALTKNGCPRHPLYLKATCRPQPLEYRP